MIKPMEGNHAGFRYVSFARRCVHPAEPRLAGMNLDAHRTGDLGIESGAVHAAAHRCHVHLPGPRTPLGFRTPAEGFADQL